MLTFKSKIMKYSLFSFAIVVMLFGCTPDDPEPDPISTKYAFVSAEEVYYSSNPPCIQEYVITCSGPGPICDDEGVHQEQFHHMCADNCSHCGYTKPGTEIHLPKAVIILNKYIKSDSLSAFFTYEDWSAIIPSLRKNLRFVNFIKERKDVRAAIGKNLIVFYLGKTFSMDKSSVLYIGTINTSY